MRNNGSEIKFQLRESSLSSLFSPQGDPNNSNNSNGGEAGTGSNTNMRIVHQGDRLVHPITADIARRPNADPSGNLEDAQPASAAPAWDPECPELSPQELLALNLKHGEYLSEEKLRVGLRIRNDQEGIGTVSGWINRKGERFGNTQGLNDRGFARVKFSNENKWRNLIWNVAISLLKAEVDDLSEFRKTVAIGSYVKVRPGIVPMRGWGLVTPFDIGRCVRLKGRMMTCSFLRQKVWRGYADELTVQEDVEELIMIRDEGPFQRRSVVGVLYEDTDEQGQFLHCMDQEGTWGTLNRSQEGFVFARKIVPRRSSMLVLDELELATRQDLQRQADAPSGLNSAFSALTPSFRATGQSADVERDARMTEPGSPK